MGNRGDSANGDGDMGDTVVDTVGGDGGTKSGGVVGSGDKAGCGCGSG